MFHVRGEASDPSFHQYRGIDTSKAEISTWEELLDLEELPDPCQGIPAGAALELRRSCAAQRQSILSQAPWGNLRGDPWFGTTLASICNSRDRAADVRADE
jgi:hypothetical protein